jgi:two-component system cell cycle sensor histidine kinase/response regulator CckA
MDGSPRHPAVPDLDPESAATLLRAVFQTGQDAIGVSCRGVIQIINPALLGLFGYEREDELVGRTVLELFTPQSRDELGEAMRRRGQGLPVSGVYQARARRRDGSEFDVEIRTTTYHLHGEAYALALLRDVSAQRSAERAREHSQQLYRAMFELNSAVKLLIDPRTGRIVDANPAAERFYGWPREQLRTMRISDVNTLSAEEIAVELEEARSGRRDYFCFRHRTAQGALRDVEVHSGPIHVDGRELLFSIVHDVTERNALEEQLRQSQRLEAIGRLAGGVAHDFNNLLTVMLGCCQLLSGAISDDSVARDTLRDLNHAAERAGELTRQLLAFSRRQLLSPRPLSLNEVVHSMQGLLRRSLGVAVELVVELEPGLSNVRADPGQLEQVVMNLALNARDAMPRGGTLTLRTRQRSLGEAELTSGLAPGDYVSLVVADTGMGMDEDTLARVFEPFFTTKATGQGTGLGLSTAYGIVTQSGGRIVARSAPGRGSEFEVILPVTPEPLPPHEVREHTSTPRGVRRRTVLLVEDLRDLRRLLARQLSATGLSVLTADSAEAALALGDEVLASIDVLVSDIVMPGRSGIELAGILLERRPQLPVLLISGDVGNHDQSSLPDRVRFLQKPFTAALLASHVEALLDATA